MLPCVSLHLPHDEISTKRGVSTWVGPYFVHILEYYENKYNYTKPVYGAIGRNGQGKLKIAPWIVSGTENEYLICLQKLIC